MNTLAKYLAESQRTYNYRIKVVGDVPAGFWKEMQKKCAQFDVVKMSEPKTTPVRKIVPDFPAFPNQSVSRCDVEFRYPAIEPQIKQLAQLMNFDPNRIVMNEISYENGLDEEAVKIDSENKDLLKDTDLPPPDKQQRDLKKDYSAAPEDHAVLKNAYRSDFTVAGGKTAPAKTTNELPQGVKSPISNIKRPPRPATGAQPRG